MADLRSDTVTKPCSAMRAAIAAAEVGDDVLGDDPTILALEDKIATMLGKEAALFVSSGTMSNAVAIRTQTQPGDEIITESTSHIYIYEGGGFAALSGCSVALVQGHSGLMKPSDVEDAIRKSDGSLGHFPNGSLVCVENTSNRGGGTCYSLEDLDEICRIAHSKNCKTHLDGARLFNAVVATGVDAARIAQDFDTVSICLSKGLGAPVGSLLVGSAADIERAHRWRKLFGGGMRQAGILAAAGLYALENNIERLAFDHERALRFATAINGLANFSVNLSDVQTNMCYVDTVAPAIDVVAALADRGVYLFDTSSHTVRVVTHLDVDDADIDRAITAFKELDNL